MDSHAAMGIKPREKNEMAQVEREGAPLRGYPEFGDGTPVAPTVF